MFNTNVLHHNPCFDPINSHVRIIALTIGIPSSIEEQGFFFKIIEYPKSKREKN